MFGSQLAVQVVRYRQNYTSAERQQTKWLLYGFSVPVGLFALNGLLSIGSSSTNGPLHPLVEGTLLTLLYLPIGLAVGIALLRYRLWDVDVVINRTLVYSAYRHSGGGLRLDRHGAGRLLQNEGSFAVSLVGAGVLAVLSNRCVLRCSRSTG